MNASALKQVKSYCEEQSLRLTKPRLEVFKILSSSQKPMGAYEILNKLGKVMENPKPPTVYRAIEFWQELGFVHRIESMNAYVACEAGHRHQGSQFMICDDCGNVTEARLSNLTNILEDSTTKTAFKPSHWNLEIHGLCGKCS